MLPSTVRQRVCVELEAVNGDVRNVPAQSRWLLKNFGKLGEQVRWTIRQDVTTIVDATGRPVVCIGSGTTHKEECLPAVAEHPIRSGAGLACTLSCVAPSGPARRVDTN